MLCDFQKITATLSGYNANPNQLIMYSFMVCHNFYVIDDDDILLCNGDPKKKKKIEDLDYLDIISE